jgi:hypothetical protein
MSLNLAVMEEVGSHAVLALPNDFNLDKFCFEFCDELSVLYQSATLEKVKDWHWEDSELQIAVIRETPIWKVFNNIYQYAEFGNTTGLLYLDGQWMFNDDDILFAIEWIAALRTKQETAGLDVFLHYGMLLVHKFLARYKLDKNSLERGDYVISFHSLDTYLPLIHPTHLSIFELGLLSGMTNLRSVRNAVYADKNALLVFKEGNRVLSTISDARDWLKGRRGFTPSPMNSQNNV